MAQPSLAQFQLSAYCNAVVEVIKEFAVVRHTLNEVNDLNLNALQPT